MILQSLECNRFDSETTTRIFFPTDYAQKPSPGALIWAGGYFLKLDRCICNYRSGGCPCSLADDPDAADEWGVELVSPPPSTWKPPHLHLAISPAISPRPGPPPKPHSQTCCSSSTYTLQSSTSSWGRRLLSFFATDCTDSQTLLHSIHLVGDGLVVVVLHLQQPGTQLQNWVSLTPNSRVPAVLSCTCFVLLSDAQEWISIFSI